MIDWTVTLPATRLIITGKRRDPLRADLRIGDPQLSDRLERTGARDRRNPLVADRLCVLLVVIGVERSAANCEGC